MKVCCPEYAVCGFVGNYQEIGLNMTERADAKWRSELGGRPVGNFTHSPNLELVSCYLLPNWTGV